MCYRGARMSSPRLRRRIITVTQRKGGVGKTTIAICVAAALARRGHEVALVDSDPQRSASQWAEPGNLEFPVYEMALEQTSVPAWAQEVRSIEAGIVIIDTAPNAREMGASIAVANLILVPCTPSGLDLDATLQTLAIIDAARERRRDRIKVILVPNRLDRRTLEGRQLLDELSTFGEAVGPPIASRAAFVRCFTSGQSVASFMPGDTADQEIQELADAIERIELEE
ncbi:cobyrinic acid a,c-diamide synthase [Nitrobacter winogradskyi]|uniref:Cobyrinic acid a,c-diamide synthase n=2 Tax=Nitrobacter winogradskyi TaxID=913 RepID=A0A4Y3W940_NITWI|nr:cobyrinic acid a,c-diamide synthase [Nitrobacter winogradskyi]